MNKLYIYADSFGAYSNQWKTVNAGKTNSGVDYHRAHHCHTKDVADRLYSSCWPDYLSERLDADLSNLGVIGASPLFTLYTWCRDWKNGWLTDDDTDVYIFIWSQHTRFATNLARPPFDYDDPTNGKNYEKDIRLPEHDSQIYMMQAAQDLKLQRDHNFWGRIYNQKQFQQITGCCPAQPLQIIKNAVQLHIWGFGEDVPFCWVNDLAPNPQSVCLEKYSVIGWLTRKDEERLHIREELRKENAWIEQEFYDGLSNHMSPDGNRRFAELLLEIIGQKRISTQRQDADTFRYW